MAGQPEPNGKGLFWTPTNGLAFSTRRRRRAIPPNVDAKAARSARVEQRKAALAEHVAEGGSISAWAAENGMSKSGATKLWRALVADMGWQAT